VCRWLAYIGEPILLETILFKPKHNMIDQSLSSHSAETPTNADGFGVGWYGTREKPGLFRSIRPAWNDFNLHDLAAQVESRLFLAHVRATSQATVQETNSHPFRYGNWLFVHNGEVFEIQKLRRDLLMGIDPRYFDNILGTTDSEIMFHLALTFGLENDPQGAIQRMAGFIEKVGRDHGVPEALWMTVGVTDGRTFYGVRYASDGQAPTLFHSKDMDEVYKINPAVREMLGPKTRVVASEPTGAYPAMWQEIPQGSQIRIREGKLEVSPFRPAA